MNKFLVLAIITSAIAFTLVDNSLANQSGFFAPTPGPSTVAGVMFMEVQGQTNVPGGVYTRFNSAETGSITVLEVGTNQADAVHPIGRITRVHLLLARAADCKMFIRLANRKNVLGFATIVEQQGGQKRTIFGLSNIQVIGYRLAPNLQFRIGRASVELSVSNWRVISNRD